MPCQRHNDWPVKLHSVILFLLFCNLNGHAHALLPEASPSPPALTTARNQGNRQGMYQIGQVWKQITANYGQSNPVWYADYNNPTRPVQSAKVISQFQEMDKKGLLPDTPEGNGIKSLLASYQDYHNGLLSNTVNGQHLPGYSNLMDAWYTYVNNLATSNPRLQSVISSVFRRAV